MRSGAAHQSDAKDRKIRADNTTGRCVLDNPAEVSRRLGKVQQTGAGV